MNMNPEGLLLLGGESIRFGSDKMKASLAGEPLYYPAYRALGTVCSHINLSVADTGAALPEPPPVSGCTWRVVRDDIPGQGPLGGIHSALRERRAHLLVVAGDLPSLQPHTLERILSARSDGGADVVAARAESSGREQPLCGLWSRDLAEQIKAYLDAGHRSVFEFLGRTHVRWVDVDDAELININRPGDMDLLTGMS